MTIRCIGIASIRVSRRDPSSCWYYTSAPKRSAALGMYCCQLNLVNATLFSTCRNTNRILARDGFASALTHGQSTGPVPDQQEQSPESPPISSDAALTDGINITKPGSYKNKSSCSPPRGCAGQCKDTSCIIFTIQQNSQSLDIIRYDCPAQGPSCSRDVILPYNHENWE